MADLPPIKVRVEEPTIPEFVVQIMVIPGGLYALTSYGKIWVLEENLEYSPETWCPVPSPPLGDGK